MSTPEAVFFPGWAPADVDAWLEDVVGERLGTGVDEIAFRSGRIDAVYGLRLSDGRQVVLKVHRPPVDVDRLHATVRVLRHLAGHGYPCPDPVDGPAVVDGHTISIQTLLTEGGSEDARRPEIRRALTRSFAEQMGILRSIPDRDAVIGGLGLGPAWTRYHDGPWPDPHDAALDFTATPAGWEWLDSFASEASRAVKELSGGMDRVVAHGDWYAGNARFEGERVVGVYDWDVAVEPEAVIVGLSSGGFLADHAPTAAEVDAYLADYGLSGRERRVAAAAARWMLAYNARCDLAVLHGEPSDGSALQRLLDDRQSYLSLG